MRQSITVVASDLPASQRLVLAAAEHAVSPSAERGARIRTLANTVEWSEVVVHARLTRSLSVLVWALTDAGAGAPDEVVAEAVAETGRQAERHAHVAATARRLGTALATENVRALLRKGLDAASRYPLPALRPVNYVDLLIDRADRRTVEGVLGDLGYAPGHFRAEEFEPLDAATRRVQALFLDALGIFALPGHSDRASRVLVDVVWQRLPRTPDDAGSTRGVLDRARKIDALGLFAADPVDHLVDSCCHAFMNSAFLHYIHQARFHKLTGFIDVAYAAAGLEDVDELVARIAPSPSVATAVAFAIGNTARVLPGVLHPDSDLVAWAHGIVSGDDLDVVGHLDGRAHDWKPPFPERLFVEDASAVPRAATARALAGDTRVTPAAAHAPRRSSKA